MDLAEGMFDEKDSNYKEFANNRANGHSDKSSSKRNQINDVLNIAKEE